MIERTYVKKIKSGERATTNHPPTTTDPPKTLRSPLAPHSLTTFTSLLLPELPTHSTYVQPHIPHRPSPLQLTTNLRLYANPLTDPRLYNLLHNPEPLTPPTLPHTIFWYLLPPTVIPPQYNPTPPAASRTPTAYFLTLLSRATAGSRGIDLPTAGSKSQEGR